MRKQMAFEYLESWVHSPGHAERLFGLWAASGGLTRTTTGYVAGPRTVAFHNMHLVLDGTVELTTRRSTPVLLGPGDLFALFPSVRHMYRALPHHPPPQMLWLSFDGPAAPALAAHLGLTPDQPCLRGLRTRPFLAHLPALRAAFDEESPRRALLTHEYLARFVGEVLGQEAARRRRSPTPAEWVQHGRDLLDAHFAAVTTVADIADRLRIDRSHFSKTFAQMVGEPPAAYLRRKRMEEGRRLLRETDLTVTEIARSVGFADLVAFSRCYRRHFSITPSADRQPAASTVA